MTASAAAYRFRRADPEDVRLLWEWANDSEVRANAFHSAPIPWESHVAWYREKLADARCLMAIFEDRGRAVGHIRLEQRPDGLEVTLSVAREQRGQGIGQELLRQGLRAARGRWPAGTLVIANVLQGNAPSARLFTEAGFQMKGTGIRMEKPYQRFECTLS